MKTLASRLNLHTLLPWVLLAGLAIDLGWHFYTGFIRDDAFITFRYARNIAEGLGFVYNPGEHVYGVSTPGFALLMAGWWFLFPSQPVAGALMFDIAAAIVSLYLVWKILEDLGLPELGRATVSIILIVSDKLLLHLLQGMENPLVIACMLAAFYFLYHDRSVWAGICAGLLLWLRVDSALWVVTLAFIFLPRFQKSWLFLPAAFLTYLPWLVFAQHYFGSIIPFTAVAKHIAYGPGGRVVDRALFLYSWLTPFTLLIDPILIRIAALITYLVAGFGIRAHRRSAFVMVLVVFFVIQTVTLIALNMINEVRYFITSLYPLLILFGLGVYEILIGPGRMFFQQKVRFVLFAAMYAIVAFYFFFPRMDHFRNAQRYVYDASLTTIGKIIKNSPPGTVVYLEPLGYIGYYSERVMWDEIGLVTPQIVPFRRAKISHYETVMQLGADLYVHHCASQGKKPENYNYEFLLRLDPLHLIDGPASEKRPSLQWLACYEIEQRVK